jgi:hypothetical protein
LVPGSRPSAIGFECSQDEQDFFQACKSCLLVNPVRCGALFFGA